MEKKTTIYRLYWRNKKRPNEMGEARPVHNEKVAQYICEESDRLFPHIQHWYE